MPEAALYIIYIGAMDDEHETWVGALPARINAKP